MLSRVTLSAARQRSFHSASRLAFAQSQHQWRIAKDNIKPGSFSNPPSSTDSTRTRRQEPLRKVYQQNSTPLPHSTGAGASRPQASQQQPSEQEDSQPLPDLRQGIPSDYDADATPQKPLPDLTQGIPSTIDAELLQARRKGGASKDSYNITEDAVDPQSPDPADRGGDGIPRSTYVSSSDRRRGRALKYFWSIFALGAIGYVAYTGRDWSEEEAAQHEDIANGYTPMLMYQRAMARYGTTVNYYKEPISKKLLPDAALVDPNMPPYTLVLGLEDVLVHFEWSGEHGWRIAKRPGLDYFLRYLHSSYELVLFSNQSDMTVATLRKKIDPYSMAHFCTREMTLWEDGSYVKDLSYLNRDLKKVVMVECDPKAVKNQPENAIVIPPWRGDPKDTTLIDLIPFLEYLSALGYEDTREVLKSFKGTDIPVEFARRQKLLRQKFEADQAKKTKKTRSLGSLFGLQQTKNPQGIQSIQAAEAEGKMYTDIIRERGQENYKMLEAHLAKEGPKMLAEQEAFEKQMIQEATANVKSGMFGWFGSSKNE